MSAMLYGPEFFAGRSPLVVQSASVLVPMIVKHLEPLSVLDVGCGQGEWVSAFQAEGCTAFGVDIAAPTSTGFMRADLTERLDLGLRFDLVLSLETGEHLPEDAADTYVRSLVHHSHHVVFSAAVVGQAGVGHINCQPHEYWHAKFAQHGYTMSDPFRPLLAGDARVSPWYSANTFLYTEATGAWS